MITCPSCRHTELDGELYCTTCGAQLWGLAADATVTIAPARKFATEPKPNTSARTAPTPPPLEALIGDADRSLPVPPGAIGLRLIDADTLLTLQGKDAYIIGREAGAESQPDAELGAHGGRDLGVSRQHARLSRLKGQVLLEDLGSANGTWLNGEPVNAGTPMRLENGDLVKFARLLVRIEFGS
ncbi:MAG: FHA domain-containing protein [Anaerolineales bacterium]|nr:FHA domain-containing protein [Anaerolineales bacterium]